MEKTEPIACSLTESELTERMASWREVASRGTSRYAEKGRIVSSYRRDERLLQQLRELIAAEAECCSFMQFNIEERPEEVVVELRVPPEMSDALAVMLGVVTQQPDSAPHPVST